MVCNTCVGLRVGRDGMWYGRWVVALCVGEGERKGELCLDR